MLQEFGPKPKASGWDGVAVCAWNHLKSVMNDPASYEFVECSEILPSREYGCWMQRLTFRAKNAFGGKILKQYGFFMKYDQVLYTLDMG